MDKEIIKKYFDDFLREYDQENMALIWNEKSKQFREFWNNRIMNNEEKTLNEAEVDQIIRILDRNAKGNTKKDQAVAKAMIPQGVWRRMFNELRQNKELREILNKIFQSDGNNVIPLIDELYKINEGRKNSLTGKSANAINAMLFAYSPTEHVSIISLNDRKKVIDFFQFINGPDFDNDTQGKKLYLSNKAILDGFVELGMDNKPRVICDFLYTSKIQSFWKNEPEEEEISEKESVLLGSEPEIADQSLFYMEKELENFLITNWDKTELGKEFELIEEDGELVSQQYSTDIGKIDILARDKKTKQYVVIELKRNQTSDDTIGQLTRYMGWLEEKKTSGKATKGIIIAAKYDERLYYALKKVKDVEVYLYQVDFKLKEFKK